MKGIPKTPNTDAILRDMLGIVERIGAVDAPELACSGAIFIVVNPDGSITHTGLTGGPSGKLALAGMLRIQADLIETGIKQSMLNAVAEKIAAQAEADARAAAGQKGN